MTVDDATNSPDEGELMSLTDLLERSGINRRTLLSWERRHGLMPTVRDQAGRRYYSEEQARRLSALRQATDAGHRIGDLVNQSLSQIEALGRRRELDPLIETILHAAIELDTQRVDTLMRHMIRKQGLESFVLEGAVALLQTIGDRWASRKMTPASEHLVSMVMNRHLLEALLEIPSPQDAPVIAAATFSGEQHEFGALGAAIIARLHSADAVYLGGSLPPRDIAATASRLGAILVMISVTHNSSSEVATFLDILRANLPATTSILVGGRMAPEHRSDGILISHDLRDVVEICAALDVPEAP